MKDDLMKTNLFSFDKEGPHVGQNEHIYNHSKLRSVVNCTKQQHKKTAAYQINGCGFPGQLDKQKESQMHSAMKMKYEVSHLAGSQSGQVPLCLVMCVSV